MSDDKITPQNNNNENPAPKRPGKRRAPENKEMQDLAKMFEGYSSVEDFNRKNEEALAEKAVSYERTAVPSAKAKQNQKSKIIRAVVLLSIGFICLAAGIFFARENSKNRVKVPAVVGLDITAARDMIEDAGLKLERIKYDPKSKEKDGKIIEQMPIGDSVTVRGTYIILTVAGQAPKDRFNTSTPGTDGKPQTPATQGGGSGNTTKGTSEVVTGDETSTQPQTNRTNTTPSTGGQGANSTQTQPLTTPTAPAEEKPTVKVDEMLTVPNYSGYQFDAVKAELERAGVAVAYRSESNSEYKKGTIIRTEPPVGSKIKAKGASIVLVVAR